MVLWFTYKSMLNSAQSVHTLDSEHQRLVAENRAYIKTVCAVLRWIATQQIAQRGHDESDQSKPRQFSGNFEACHTVRYHCCEEN